MTRGGRPGPAISVTASRTIRAISRDAWQDCFPGEPEGWAYYCAIEASDFAAFSWVYFVARERDRVLAVVPAFVTDYPLETTLQGPWRAILRPLFARLGALLTPRMLCLGSPLADACHLGFAAGVPTARHRELTEALLKHAAEFADAHAIGLVAAKDVGEKALSHGVGEAFSAAGYARQPGLPNTALVIPDGGEAAYLASLSPAVRKDVRRKLRRSDLVRIDRRRGTEALPFVQQMNQLYNAQRERSAADYGSFETLSEAYFRQVLVELGDAAVVFFYSHQNRLIAFNLCFEGKGVLIDKFIGFAMPESRALNLYVLSWMTNLRYCAQRDIPVLQAGQTAYAMKLRLGAQLQPSWLHFRHRNRAANAALRFAAPLLAADRHDRDLRRATSGASRTSAARATLWTLWSLLLALDVAIQITMKLAGDRLAGIPMGAGWALAAASSWLVWLSLAGYLATLVLWLAILRSSPLSAAFPVTALTYILVPLSGWLWLDERFSLAQGIGVTLIVAGVLLQRDGGGKRSSGASD